MKYIAPVLLVGMLAASSDDVSTLAQEVRALRAEILALRQEVAELRARVPMPRLKKSLLPANVRPEPAYDTQWRCGVCRDPVTLDDHGHPHHINRAKNADHEAKLSDEDYDILVRGLKIPRD